MGTGKTIKFRVHGPFARKRNAFGFGIELQRWRVGVAIGWWLFVWEYEF
ncbi:hypothetical protein LCGC14_1703130 [marine sediment metagenome]|uniref:Uncharacterized protein n=1 Tax=marine sediment metagenome TaxID=412755 RepID=A0A0F9JXV2_9ZZZZ